MVRGVAVWRTPVVAAVATVALAATACFGRTDPDASTTPSPTPQDLLGTITIGPGEPIELGTMLAEASGASSPTGADALRGVKLAVDFLDGSLDGKPGALLNHPVELSALPEACDGTGPEDLRDDAIASIVGVIGPGCARALGVEPATSLSSRGVVMISPMATEAELTDPATRLPTFFRTAYNDLVEGAAVASFAIEEAGAVRGGVATDEAGSIGAASSFRTTFDEAGGIVVVSGTMEGSADVARVVRALSLGRPDVAYLVGRRPACDDAAREAASLASLRAVPVVTSVGCFDPAFVEDNATTPQVYLSGPDLTRLLDDDFYRMEFLPAYREQFGTSPTGAFHAQAYDATLMLLDAIDRIADRAEDGTITIGRSALLEAVAATSGVSGISGTITCTDTGDCAPDAAMAIYLVPGVPLEGGSPDAEPVFSEVVALTDILPPA